MRFYVRCHNQKRAADDARSKNPSIRRRRLRRSSTSHLPTRRHLHLQRLRRRHEHRMVDVRHVHDRKLGGAAARRGRTHHGRDFRGGAGPGAQAELLVRQALQLERAVCRPFEAVVDVEVALALDVGDAGLEGVGEDDEGAAEREDDGEAEGAEGGVGRAADFLGGWREEVSECESQRN